MCEFNSGKNKNNSDSRTENAAEWADVITNELG